METFSDFNNSQRNKPGLISFKKRIFKLINNAVYGKTMENVRLYSTAKLCTDAKKFTNKIVHTTWFVQSIAIHENLEFCKMQNMEVILNQPIFIGGCILDISKLHLYKFQSDIIKKKCGENAIYSMVIQIH